MSPVAVVEPVTRFVTPVDPVFLRTLAARASFLWERLDTRRYAIESDGLAQEEVTHRLDRWQRVVGGDAQALEKRLQWDGLDVAGVRSRLGIPRLASGEPLPGWTATLQDIMRAAAEGGFRTAMASPAEPSAPLPFEDLLLPAVYVARCQLLSRVASDRLREDHLPLSVVTASAYRSLERGLLSRLSALCAEALELEFAEHRPFGPGLLGGLGMAGETRVSTKHYDAFVGRLLGEGLRSFFQEYPVLARHVATTVEFWSDFVAECAERLRRDAVDIERVFSKTAGPLGRVNAIRAGLSDPHRRGRTVMSLSFESGLRLVYKPKDVGLELAFNDLLAWCNERGALPAFHVTRVLSRDGYGWVQHVEHLPCSDAGAAEQYYQRAGMLLCLLYALRATDCHYENIIASGSHPVLVDMETLLHHDPKLIDDSPFAREAEGVAAQTLWDSVLRTGLLPRWERGADDVYDISGLGRPQAQRATRQILEWKLLNSDAMRREEAPVTFPAEANAPRIGDRVLSASDYRADIVAGFAGMYRFLLESREALLAADSPLGAMRDQKVRFIFRRTRTYGAIQEAALAPGHLHDGADFSIELDHLSRAFLVAQAKPTAFPVLQAELRAMEQLDVPLFTAGALVDELSLGALPPIQSYFKRASFEDVLQQLRSLTEDDLARQVAIINGSFDAKVATLESGSAGAWVAEALPVLRPDELVEAARAIATDLETRAITDADGSLNWIGLAFLPEVDRFQLQVLNNSLCDGRGGVAVFLAALSRVTGDGRYAELALRALQAVRRQIRTLDRGTQALVARFDGVGGATGVPSTIYCLAKVGLFLDDATLLQDACRLTECLTPELIAQDRHLDVMSGAAGGILCLAALYEATGDGNARQAAIACGRHLVARQGEAARPPRAWKTFWDEPLTGFSHGAAGITYALARLHAMTGDGEFLAATREGLAYERSVFDAARANWPDYRRIGGSKTPAFATRWCHGAPGIGLARLGTSRYLDGPEIGQEIEVALQTTARCDLDAVDHLCCGNFGRSEVLVVGARRLGRTDWFDTALLNVTNAVARAQRTGAYQLFPHLPGSVFNPGFLAGTAGIGYQLLRLATEDLPSILSWE